MAPPSTECWPDPGATRSGRPSPKSARTNWPARGQQEPRYRSEIVEHLCKLHRPA